VDKKHPNQNKITVQRDTTLDRWIDVASAKAGFKFKHHTLRRTCGRSIYLQQLEARQVNLPAIQKFLGHESMETTIHYLGIGMVDMESMMATAAARRVKRLPTLNCNELVLAR